MGWRFMGTEFEGAFLKEEWRKGTRGEEHGFQRVWSSLALFVSKDYEGVVYVRGKICAWLRSALQEWWYILRRAQEVRTGDRNSNPLSQGRNSHCCFPAGEQVDMGEGTAQASVRGEADLLYISEQWGDVLNSICAVLFNIYSNPRHNDLCLLYLRKWSS